MFIPGKCQHWIWIWNLQLEHFKGNFAKRREELGWGRLPWLRAEMQVCCELQERLKLHLAEV